MFLVAKYTTVILFHVINKHHIYRICNVLCIYCKLLCSLALFMRFTECLGKRNIGLAAENRFEAFQFSYRIYICRVLAYFYFRSSLTCSVCLFFSRCQLLAKVYYVHSDRFARFIFSLSLFRLAWLVLFELVNFMFIIGHQWTAVNICLYEPKCTLHMPKHTNIKHYNKHSLREEKKSSLNG